MNWADNIPEGGVLCKHPNGAVILIANTSREYDDCVDSVSGGLFLIADLTPLTPSEWWDFAPWQTMDSAPRDGSEILAFHIDGKKPHLVYWKSRRTDIPQWATRLNEHYHTTDAFYSGWLPLPEQSK